MPFLFVFFIMLPVLEIISFVLVSRAIGLFPMLLLLAVSGAIGLFLIRMQTFDVARKATQALRQGSSPTKPMFRSGMISLAGVLFLIPGFFSDCLAVLLLLPPVQAVLLRNISITRWQSRAGTGQRPPQPPQSPPAPPKRTEVIDVEFDEVSPPNKPKPDGKNGSPWGKA